MVLHGRERTAFREPCSAGLPEGARPPLERHALQDCLRAFSELAKSRLTGTHNEVPLEKGSHVPLMDKGEQIGVVLRTRTNVKPLYISPDHRVSIETAHRLVMKCVTKYCLPETTRRAHKLASG